MRDQLDKWLLRNGMPPTTSKEERRDYFDSMPERVKNEWDIHKAATECNEDPKYNMAVAARAAKRMERVDAMPPELRAVVYEYGLEIVQEFVNCGIKMPSRIKHLIDTVRNADFENGQRRFKVNKGPNTKRNPIELEDDDDIFRATR